MGSCPNEGKLEEIWRAIEVSVQAGKILYAGSSNFAGCGTQRPPPTNPTAHGPNL